MHGRTTGLLPVVVILLITLAACSSSASPAGNGPTPGAASADTATGGAAGGANGFEGSLVTSGLYDATWTVSPGQQADPLNSVTSTTLVSDKGTFGNIGVMPDGAVSFGSGAPELSGQYSGTGAQVTLDETGAFVCSFTVDTDVVAGDGTKLRLAGTLTVHWHPEGLGGLNCP